MAVPFRRRSSDIVIVALNVGFIAYAFLAEMAPDLGRPVVGRIQSWQHQSMRELGAAMGGALRVLFLFDPRHRAILLLGGDTSGEWNDWYAWAVPLTDDMYDEYFRELGEKD